METKELIFFLFILLLFQQTNSLLLHIIESQGNYNASQLHTYIVHLQKPHTKKLVAWHKSFLPNTTLDSGEPRLLYSYRNVVSGFAARLTHNEVKAMESMDGFLDAQLEQRMHLHTTYTPEFLGLSDWSATWGVSLYGEGIVMGVLDTGIEPIHLSFGDDLMPPPPIGWKGRCSFHECNNKIIGATAFLGKNQASPLDANGHGTHVSGIAAGNFVDDANLLGMAKGLASGVAPKAHLSIYKVCTSDGCDDSDVLAGIDQAIHDQVDVLLMPFGGLPRPMYQDSVAIGSLAAFKNGILVCASAGNLGPRKSMVSNEAPWILTVGASSIDRRIRVSVKLGNGIELYGESAYQPSGSTSTGFLPIVFPGIDGDWASMNCYRGSLDEIDVRGKIVLCYNGGKLNVNIWKGEHVKDLGGAAMIIMNYQNQGFTTFAESHRLPVSHVNYIDGRKIRSYVYSSRNCTPKAAIFFNNTIFGARPSRSVASFSSRGPSLLNGGVLKPDIIAPGINILSASSSSFDFRSGTSMAAAHVTGIVALIKNKHPNWSPSAMKSAVMTSAHTFDIDNHSIFDESSYNKSAELFAKGAGLANTLGAMDPGLVYEIYYIDYIYYLCGLNYTNKQVSIVHRSSVHCNSSIGSEQLNYPSISVSLGSTLTKTVIRTVTNVGEANSVYLPQIDEPEGVRIDLSCYKLSFSRLHQKLSFDIRFSVKGGYFKKGHVSEGKLSWISDKHVVSSPISIRFI